MTEPHARVVVVFARAPQRGTVKTRLAASVGDDEALAIYRELAEGVVRGIQDAGWRVVIRCSPDDGVTLVRDWLGQGLSVKPQGPGDLGARMAHAMEAEFASGAQRVVIVGTDCPEVTADVIRGAFAALDHVSVVFGPAFDGGYYLVGASQPVPAVFRDVPWSSADTLAVSLRRAGDGGHAFAQLRPLGDIDTESDWRAWLARRSTWLPR